MRGQHGVIRYRPSTWAHGPLPGYRAEGGSSKSVEALSAAPLLQFGQAALVGRADRGDRVAAQRQAQGRLVHGGDLQQDLGGLAGIAGLSSVVLGLHARRAPTTASYSGRPAFSVVEAPAKSVRKPPGSTIVTLTPTEPSPGQDFREALDSPLGGRVGGPAGRAQPPAHRGDLDEVAGALLAQQRDGGLGDDDRAEQVGVDLLTEVLQRSVLDRADVAVAGVVDDDVQPPNASTARATARAAALGSVTSRAARRTASPWRSARSTRPPGSRAVATTDGRRPKRPRPGPGQGRARNR
jgi:hypothetical protein